MSSRSRNGNGKFSFKKAGTRAAFEPDEGVTVKKEPITVPEWNKSPPPKRLKSGKRKLLQTGRGSRIEEMQKLHGLPLVEFAQAFVGEDLIKLADSLGPDPDEAAVRGLLSCGTRRAMVRYLWVDVKVRDVLCRLMLPDAYPERKVTDAALAFNKAYTHLSSRFRKTIDEYCASLMVSLKDAYGEGKQLEAILRTQESFDDYFEVAQDDIASFWSFASIAVAPEYLVQATKDNNLEASEWREYVGKVTACYVRKRLYLMNESGGQISPNGGIVILSGKDLRELHDNFIRGRVDKLPKLGVLPTGPREWGAFCKQPEKLVCLVEIVDDILNDNLKSLGVPNLGQANQNLKKMEKAITFEEVQVEEKIEEFDLGHLLDAEDDLPEVIPVEMPEDLGFGTVDNRGELLAALSTAGLMEYLNLRYTVEYDDLGDVITSVHARREALLELQRRIRNMGAELENRRKVLQRLEEDLRNTGAKVVQEAAGLVRKPNANAGDKAARGGLPSARREYKLSGEMFRGGGQEPNNGNGKQAPGKVDPRSLMPKKVGVGAKTDTSADKNDMENIVDSVELKEEGEEDDHTDDTLKDAEALEEY